MRLYPGLILLLLLATMHLTQPKHDFVSKQKERAKFRLLNEMQKAQPDIFEDDFNLKLQKLIENKKEAQALPLKKKERAMRRSTEEINDSESANEYTNNILSLEISGDLKLNVTVSLEGIVHINLTQPNGDAYKIK